MAGTDLSQYSALELIIDLLEQEVDSFHEIEDRMANICEGGRCFPGAPGGPCVVQRTQTAHVLSSGSWLTRWCHDHNAVAPGNFYGLSFAKSTSVTISAQADFTVPVLKALSFKFGKSITKTKSVGSFVGCTNYFNDGRDHGVWWQEKMGWAWVNVVTEITPSGTGW